jgi:hypothetical protein
MDGNGPWPSRVEQARDEDRQKREDEYHDALMKASVQRGRIACAISTLRIHGWPKEADILAAALKDAWGDIEGKLNKLYGE